MIEIGIEERKRLQVDMLKDLDAFCREHHLTYYLAFGTLLGAIRHKGYIPWDDDVDIMMPRKDYERLREIYPKDGRYRFLTQGSTKNYPYAFGKIIDTRTVKKEKNVRPKYQIIGLDIDVFPIDHYPNTIEEAKQWCEEISETQKLSKKLYSPYVIRNSLIKTIARNVIVFFSHILDNSGILTVKQHVSRIDTLCKKYHDVDSGYLGIAAINTYGVKKRNRNIVYSSAIDVDFEGELFPAPVGYDEYLKDIYGDYMQFPPVEKRKSHHSFTVYWK